VAEHVHDQVSARTLFATHYHELCALPETHPRVRNVSVAAQEWQGEVVFLRKLNPGGTSRSFGVEVARLAGLPSAVVARARAILERLELGSSARSGDGPSPAHPESEAAPQLSLFAKPAQPRAAVAPLRQETRADEVAAALSAADLDDLSPRAAWDLLARLQKKLTTPG
jgi:DNA mismatch repair protein MutS